MITSDHPLYFLAGRIQTIPPDYWRVTVPIDDIEIVRSVFQTLKATEALVTVQGDAVTFWRRRQPNVNDERRLTKGKVSVR